MLFDSLCLCSAFTDLLTHSEGLLRSSTRKYRSWKPNNSAPRQQRKRFDASKQWNKNTYKRSSKINRIKWHKSSKPVGFYNCSFTGPTGSSHTGCCMFTPGGDVCSPLRQRSSHPHESWAKPKTKNFDLGLDWENLLQCSFSRFVLYSLPSFQKTSKSELYFIENASILLLLCAQLSWTGS